jgi:hypothetical protein
MSVRQRTISSPGAKSEGKAALCETLAYHSCRLTLLSYVAALELRIEKMERRLAFARSRKASLAQHGSESFPSIPQGDRKDSLANIQAAMYRKAARNRENSDVNSLMSDFGFLCVISLDRFYLGANRCEDPLMQQQGISSPLRAT